MTRQAAAVIDKVLLLTARSIGRLFLPFKGYYASMCDVWCRHLQSGVNSVYYVLKSCVFIEVGWLRISGRTSRDKSIIDVLIFRNGHVLHHSPTIKVF
jgi:hypothetical protein